MSSGAMKNKMAAFRLTKVQKEKLDKITDKKRDPYAPSITQLLSRGLDLALKELEQK